ncbi:MAG: hypothetical protein ACYC69_15830 [Thermodesulfovibrionales bacterium]
MKIPINQAIDSGAWFQCVSGFYEPYDECTFRFRIDSFDRVNLAEVDNPKNINLDLSGGILWLMKAQLINLNKQGESTLPFLINIVDSDDYWFKKINDDHLEFNSIYAKSSGLNNFFGKSYIPKIKYTGALLFLLPDEAQEYFVSVLGGNMMEV